LRIYGAKSKPDTCGRGFRSFLRQCSKLTDKRLEEGFSCFSPLTISFSSRRYEGIAIPQQRSGTMAHTTPLNLWDAPCWPTRAFNFRPRSCTANQRNPRSQVEVARK